MSAAAPSFTLGIEEEYFLVDRRTRDLVRQPPAALLKQLEAKLGDQVKPEFLAAQIEVATGRCRNVAEARADLARLRKVAGEAVARRIRRVPDPFIEKVVAGWPRRFEARRAAALGFTAEASFEDIIRIHIEDELGGRIA